MGDETLRNLGAESSARIAAPWGGLRGRGPGGQDAETRLRKQRGVTSKVSAGPAAGQRSHVQREAHGVWPASGSNRWTH